jgi:predicted solute-binding protein
MLKVGALHFTNAYPLFFALHQNIIPNDLTISWGNPIEINSMLNCGEVDVAMISSGDFLNHRFSYILLSDLGIAGTEQIMSLRLFFKGKTLKPHNCPLYVPALSATSAQLIQKMCTHFWHVSPKLQPYPCPPEELFSQEHPFLLIGDLCLEHHTQRSHSSIDLAKVWHDATKKSFIFAVIATRNDAFARSPHEVIAFHRLLEDSYQWSLKNRDAVVSVAARRAKCSEEFMQTYFTTIEYRLLPKHFHGLDYFAGLEG